MKILYVCTSTETGGAEKALLTQALAAQEAAHTVRIVSLKPLGAIGQNMVAGGLDVISFDMQGRGPLQTAGVLARLVQEIQSFQPCIVHAFLYRAIQFCRMAKRRVPFKLITTPHYDLSRKNYFLRLLDRALKNEDDISCAESESTEKYLKNKQKYDEKKLRLISNGVDVEKFSPGNEQERLAARQKWGFSEEETVFVCVARLSAEKNHILLLESFAMLYAKNLTVRLLLAGDGSERDKLQEIVAQKGLEKVVIFAGEVSDIREILLASDIFILSSYIESLPLALLESCSCALPSIVSKVGDMPQVVQHGENGFVFNGKDTILLAVLMAELAENKTLRKQMGKKSRQFIKQKFPASERFYLKIYKEI